MMLFEIIRDWFVMNIWGGNTSTGDFYPLFIGEFSNSNYDYANGNLAQINVPVGNIINSEYDLTLTHINLADWLSTTSTIIVLIALCFFFFLMVRWLFRLTAGLIQGRG